MNEALGHIARAHRGVYLMDYDAMVVRYGRARWYDECKWLTMRMPIAADHLANEWLRIVHPLTFAQDLYVNAKEARKMQAGGMVIGGHSNQHKPLSSLSDKELESDLKICHESPREKLYDQSLWPFFHPYGNRDSFASGTLRWLKTLGFACAFSTEVGPNTPGSDLFAIRRFDCNDI